MQHRAGFKEPLQASFAGEAYMVAPAGFSRFGAPARKRRRASPDQSFATSQAMGKN